MAKLLPSPVSGEGPGVRNFAVSDFPKRTSPPPQTALTRRLRRHPLPPSGRGYAVFKHVLRQTPKPYPLRPTSRSARTSDRKSARHCSENSRPATAASEGDNSGSHNKRPCGSRGCRCNCRSPDFDSSCTPSSTLAKKRGKGKINPRTVRQTSKLSIGLSQTACDAAGSRVITLAEYSTDVEPYCCRVRRSGQLYYQP